MAREDNTHFVSRSQVEFLEGRSVYRFFRKAWEADALVAGKVWISTLETCRNYEDPLQGDREEGHVHYRSGRVVGNSGDKEFDLIAARSRVDLGPGCSNITLDCSSIIHLQDAFVLCTTKEFNPKKLSDTFGKYCVEILNPKEFFEHVSRRLADLHQVTESAMRRVIYKERKFFGLENPPGPLGFVKPPDQYQDQKEVRLLWIVGNPTNIMPFLLDVPEVVHLCRRIV